MGLSEKLKILILGWSYPSNVNFCACSIVKSNSCSLSSFVMLGYVSCNQLSPKIVIHPLSDL